MIPKSLFTHFVDFYLYTKIYKFLKAYKVTKINIEIAYPHLNTPDVEQVSRLSIRESIISGYETIFDLHVKLDILGFFNFSTFVHQTFTSKTASFKHVSDKVPRGK